MKQINPKKENTFPTKMEYKNQTFYDPQNIVNILNSCFTSVADKLVLYGVNYQKNYINVQNC